MLFKIRFFLPTININWKSFLQIKLNENDCLHVISSIKSSRNKIKKLLNRITKYLKGRIIFI